MEKIISLCKQRGFINQSSEPYGGFSSSYDYGPLGVELKNNYKKLWWDEMTKNQNGIVGLDSAILMNPKIWEASGHLSAGFADKLVECKSCHKRFKLQDLENQENKCPECGGELMSPKNFNLMMKTFIGPVEDEASLTYLRAETCQGIFMNFKWIENSMRLKIPFGVCQIGKAFRNEITPSNFTYRTREFEQMEMEFFIKPEEAEKWFDYWTNERFNWYLKLGIKKENLRLTPHKELAHYAKKGVDIEYHFPFGWNEVEGIHHRGDWDLGNHSKYSGKDLSYYNSETGEKYVPYVIETSAGCDRGVLMLIIDSYREIEGGRTKTTTATKEKETLLQFNYQLAPIKAAILPLVKKDEQLVQKAKEVYNLLRQYFRVWYDEIDSIGRRYRRQDEIGTPWCITIDSETLDNNTVTVRNRDTMAQERISIQQLKTYLEEN